MSWMQRLFETYERCAGREADGLDRLMPISHTNQQAQIEVTLDQRGAFRGASVLSDKDKATTLIPCTEESGGRAGSKPVNHPLCDKLQYVAGDFVEFGGEVTSGFASDASAPHREFLRSLRGWANSDYAHPKLDAILRYVERGSVVADLVQAGILPVDENRLVLKSWTGEREEAPPIFKAIQNTQAPEDAFVRWRIEDDRTPIANTWDDSELIASWVSYYKEIQTKRGICMVTGKESTLAVQHPAKLRHGGDKAKLISSNDTSGYTFRGRFLEADEAATVGFEVTQKAHNALRWLVKNQSYRSGDFVVASWAVTGKVLPNPCYDTMDLFLHVPEEQVRTEVSSDTAQEFGLRLARAIAGYGSTLDPGEEIVVMAIDSATPGRMGIPFYRELRGSEFLERVKQWHSQYAWSQNFGKNSKFVGAPAPRDIAEAAYGRRLDDKLRKATLERLLPCIVDARLLPRDLVLSTVHRATNRVGLERWEWEKVLGIACSLWRGHYIDRRYQMALEEDRRSRDYLFGRLLAIADDIESYALWAAKEERSTTAARLTQRFADRPLSTWRTIEMGIRPYAAKLRSGEKKWRDRIFAREKLLDVVVSMFNPEDFTSEARLSGEFLLGYHCQRQALRPSASPNDTKDTDVTGEEK
ncbi:type I-C CRISPR-associated protein Cas8c/Csd1 [Bryobacter aggregatus]|uniref:type I-C CRISPR-associated protein Cas8c/Csd1 n=1 Tax=Bryobacter aggregatus TaxID=360054 RepID=UPI0004E1C6D1|nr:type I-C CRISPR-associated protein Cas8c/Csd1 [Bryobacter aggregatus]